MRASIVIAAHNEGDLLWKTVQACQETITELEYEIVVVDDASVDDSAEAIRRRHEDVKLIVSPSRTGTSAAKDLAARSSRGDVLVFLDAHCKPEPGAIERLVQDVERWHETAIVSPRIAGLDPLRWENHASPGCNGFWVDLEWFHTGWMTGEAMSRVVDERGRLFHEQPSLVGCCFAVSRTLYERLWGFDRDMRSWGVEDLDLGLKCWLLGSRLLIDPEAVIGHRFRKENGTYSVPAEHVYANRLRMARKNFGESVWTDWLERTRRAATEELWEKAWSCFEETRESAERERDYLMQRRLRDEFEYAAEFGLVWPLILPSSPLPPPLQPARPRFSAFDAIKPTIHTITAEAPRPGEVPEPPTEPEPQPQPPAEPEPEPTPEPDADDSNCETINDTEPVCQTAWSGGSSAFQGVPQGII